MFRNTVEFNQDLSNWNVSAVTDMREMFRNSVAFNQDLSDWNVAAGTDMHDMFRLDSWGRGAWRSRTVGSFNTAFKPAAA
jgi:surface protein